MSYISITGTPNGTKFLRDDFTWQDAPGGTPSWGDILGTISDQTDLQDELDAKLSIDELDDEIQETDTIELINDVLLDMIIEMCDMGIEFKSETINKYINLKK